MKTMKKGLLLFSFGGVLGFVVGLLVGRESPDVEPHSDPNVIARGAASEGHANRDRLDPPSADLARRDSSLAAGVDAPRSADSALPATLLFGRVLSAAGDVLEVGTVHARAGVESLRASVEQGRYAFPNIEPGTWSIESVVPGLGSASVDVTIEPGSFARADLLLSGGTVVRAHLQTPSGEPFYEAFWSMAESGAIAPRLTLVATLDQPGGRIVASDGAGGVRQDCRPLDGSVLHLRAASPPPIHTSLLIGDQVIETRSIRDSESDLTFILDLNDLGARYLGRLRMRLVDAAGVPVRGSVSASAIGSNRGLQERSEDGVVAFDALEPGHYRLRIWRLDVRDSAYLERFARISPGELLDLGAVEFLDPVPISGRVFTATGAPPRSYRVRCFDLELWETQGRVEARNSPRCDTSGDFVFEILPPGRYLIFAEADGALSRSEIVDTSLGPVDDASLSLEAASLVAFELPLGRRAIITDEHGLPVLEFDSNRSRITRSMLPGRYTLTLEGPAGHVAAESIVVGSEGQLVEWGE